MDSSETKKLSQKLAKAFMTLNKNHQRIQTDHKMKKSEFILLHIMIDAMKDGKNGIKASDLSTRLEITPAAVTHMLNSLEKEQYVERFADSSDRRIVLVKPTQSAKEIIEIMEKEFFKKFEGLIDYLGEKDTNELIRILTAASAYFKKNNNKKE